MLRTALAFASIAVVFAACAARSSTTDGGGGDSSAGGNGTSGTASSASAASTGSGGSVPNGCNGLSNTAPEFQPNDVVANAPMPMGGTILDGVYYESSETHYAQAEAGPDGVKRKTTLVVNANGTNWQFVSTPMGQVDYQSSVIVDPKGIDLGDQRTCPDSGVLLLDQYTATPTQIIVYQVFTGVVLIAETFDKQP